MKLFILLLFFTATVNSAVLLDAQHPIYVFKLNNETLMCKVINRKAVCYAQNIQGIIVQYTCTLVLPNHGYIKDCYTKPTINLD